MRKAILITSTLLAAASLAEIAAIEFGIGFPLLSIELSRIILSLSYAFFASWIFYMLVVVIPDAWSYRHRSMVIARRLYHLIYCIEDIFQTIARDAKIDHLASPEDLSLALDIIDSQIDTDYQEFTIKHIKSLIQQCYAFSAHMDPMTLRVLDRIDFLMLSVGFGTRTEGKTLGQALANDMWKLRTLNERIRKGYHRTIEQIEKEIHDKS